MWLAMNVEDCGDFDDVILCKKEVGCAPKTYIMQLKHQDNPKNIVRDQLLSDKGNYSLKKYENCLSEMQNKINSLESGKNPILNHFCGNNNVIPIIFTNNGINPYGFLKDGNNSSNVFLNTCQGNIFKVDYADLGYKVTQNTFGYFEKLCLFTNQSSISGINDLIETVIRTLVSPLEVSIDLFHKLVQKYVAFVGEWTRGLLGGHYPLTKTHVLRKLAELFFEPYISKFYETERLMNNKFRTKLWNDIMQEQDVTILDLDAEVTQFLLEYVIRTSTKFDKNLHGEKEYRKQMLRCVSLSEKCTLVNDYEYLWKTKKVPLALEATSKQDYKNLICVLRIFKGLYKIIILSNKNQTVEKPEIEKQKVFTVLSDLNYDHVQLILNTDIKLQGRSGIKLSELINNKNSNLELVTAKDIIHILSNRFNIGNVLNPLPAPFIKRRLHRILLEPKVLETNNETFIIKCKTLKKLKAFVHKCRLNIKEARIQEYSSVSNGKNLEENRIIVMQNLENIKIKQLSAKYLHQIILHDSGDLEWIKSTGSTKIIRLYRSIPEDVNLKPEAINSAESCFFGEVKLVSAASGMGKSVLLDYVARQTSVGSWVLRINLKDHLDYYHSKKFKSSIATDHLHHFNASILEKNNCNSNFAQMVFQELLNSKNVLLLLDGFDEISFGFKQEVTTLLLALQRQGLPMWLTTRPVMREYLEEVFDMPSFSLSLLNQADQFGYLTKYYWKLNNDFVQSSQKQEGANEFSSRLLQTVLKNFDDPHNRFMGVPLHIKLLADMYKHKYLNYISTGNLRLSENFDLVRLYEVFIKAKTEIFHEKYCRFVGDVCNHYEKYQQLLAIKYLFPNDMLRGTKVEERLHRFTDVMTSKLLQRAGIVVPEDELDITRIHRTYAEYLAAKWLSDHFLNIEYKQVSQMLIRKLFDPGYETIKRLFDKILAKNCDLHNVIINGGQMGQVNIMIKHNPSLLNTVDKGGRSPLHLLATKGVYHPIPLPDNIQYVKIVNVKNELIVPAVLLNTIHDKDLIFGYTPLEYAAISCCLRIMDIICSKSGNLTLKIAEKDVGAYLYYCAVYGYASLCQTVLKNCTPSQARRRMTSLDLSSLQTPLYYAVLKNRTEIVDLLLSHGADANKPGPDGKTPLHIAADNGFEDLVLLLLSNGAYIDKLDNVNFTPLHHAALTGHANIVTLLLSSCCVKTDRSSSENSAYRIYEDIYDYHAWNNTTLKGLDKTKYVNMVDKDKNTALHFSSLNGFTAIVSLLLANGSDGNLMNSNGYTPLHLACCKGHTSTVFVLLSSRTVNVNMAARKNSTAAPYLATSYGGDVQTYNDPSTPPSTALHEATRGGYTKIVSLLLSSGVNVNLTSSRGFTALHEAAKGGHKQILSLLLSREADANIRSSRGSSALHEAARAGHAGLVFLLMNSVSNINQEDDGGYTALHEAAWKGHSETVLTLVSSRATDVNAKSRRSTTALYLAAKHGHRDVVSLLLSKSAHVNVVNVLGSTALHKAVQGGHKDIVSLLLSNAANINSADAQGRTPLYVACSFGHAHIVSLLLAKNAYTEKANKHGVTVLHEAAYQGDVDVVRELLVYKARANVKDSVGKTALHHAVIGKNLLVIKQLIQHGADINVRDLDANRPLDLAKKLNYMEIVQYLEQF